MCGRWRSDSSSRVHCASRGARRVSGWESLSSCTRRSRSRQVSGSPDSLAVAVRLALCCSQRRIALSTDRTSPRDGLATLGGSSGRRRDGSDDGFGHALSSRSARSSVAGSLPTFHPLLRNRPQMSCVDAPICSTATKPAQLEVAGASTEACHDAPRGSSRESPRTGVWSPSRGWDRQPCRSRSSFLTARAARSSECAASCLALSLAPSLSRAIAWRSTPNRVTNTGASRPLRAARPTR